MPKPGCKLIFDTGAALQLPCGLLGLGWGLLKASSPQTLSLPYGSTEPGGFEGPCGAVTEPLAECAPTTVGFTYAHHRTEVQGDEGVALGICCQPRGLPSSSWAEGAGPWVTHQAMAA